MLPVVAEVETDVMLMDVQEVPEGSLVKLNEKSANYVFILEQMANILRKKIDYSKAFDCCLRKMYTPTLSVLVPKIAVVARTDWIRSMYFTASIPDFME